MSLPATEAFTDTDGVSLTAHSASWTNNYAAFAIFTNSLRPNGGDATTDACAHWNADAFANDQYAQAVWAASAVNYMGVSVRVHAAAATFYDLIVSTGDQYYLAKYIAGTGTNLGTANSTTLAVNDVIRIEASGTSITGKEDAVIMIGPITDASIASGYAGVCGSGSGTGTRIDTWEGGNIPNFAVRPSYVDFPKPVLQGAY